MFLWKAKLMWPVTLPWIWLWGFKTFAQLLTARRTPVLRRTRSTHEHVRALLHHELLKTPVYCDPKQSSSALMAQNKDNFAVTEKSTKAANKQNTNWINKILFVYCHLYWFYFTKKWNVYFFQNLECFMVIVHKFYDIIA